MCQFPLTVIESPFSSLVCCFLVHFWRLIKTKKYGNILNIEFVDVIIHKLIQIQFYFRNEIEILC